MKHYTVSKLTDKEYCFDECVRIINMKQALFYITNGVPILDIYPSLNYQSQKQVLVFIVDRQESKPIYNQWIQLKDTKELVCNIVSSNEFDPKFVKILNVQQVIFYLNHKAKLLEVAPVEEMKSKDCVLAFIFDRNETEEIYKLWQKQKENLL